MVFLKLADRPAELAEIGYFCFLEQKISKIWRFATDRVKFVLGENGGGGKKGGFLPPPQDPFIKWSKCAPLTQKFFWRDFYVLLGHTRYDFQKVHG